MDDARAPGADDGRPEISDLTRRTFLAGIGVGAVAGAPGSALAASGDPVVERVRDSLGRWGLDVHYGGTWQLRLPAFGPKAVFSAIQPLHKTTKVGDAYQHELVGIDVKVAGASFLSDESAYRIVFRPAKGSAGAWTLSLCPGAWLEGHWDTFSSPVDLAAFIAGRDRDSAAVARPSFALTVVQAERVRRRLFGERLQVLKPLIASFSIDGS